MKYKGMKVRRSRKNLYKRRKSTGRKIAEVVLVIVIIAALVFIGYSVAPPLIKFFTGQNTSQTESSEPAWTPPVTEETTTTQDTTVTTPAPEPPPEKLKQTSVTVPGSALESEAALKKFVQSAKTAGYDKIVFVLKDATGKLLYNSQIESIKGNNTIVNGKLTAKQIADICLKEDIVPSAAVTTLFDHLTPTVLTQTNYFATEEQGGWIWHDADEEHNGQRWMSPFQTDTLKYFGDITAELTKAGFEEVVLQDTVFPPFGNYDKKVLSANHFAENRSDKLALFAQSCAKKAGDAGALVQIDLKELLTLSGSAYKGTAEIWLSKEKMPDCTVLVTMDSALLGKKLKINDTTEIAVSEDIKKAISQTFVIVNQVTGSADIAVGIENSSKLTAQQRKSAEETFAEMGYKNIIFM